MTETMQAVFMGVLAALALVQMGALIWLIRRRAPIGVSYENEMIEILRRIDTRVTPAPKPTLPPEQAPAFIETLVREAFDVGEHMGTTNKANGVKVTGRDKQREAMNYIKTRLNSVGLDHTQFPELARKVEAEVARRKETKP